MADTHVDQGSGDDGSSARLIKRYSNRKLYDTRDSRYVTLQQIGEYVRAGEDVRIIDNNSKEDLTNVTLAQIIYETEKHGDPRESGAAARKLRDMIQKSGEKLITTLREGPVGKLVPQPGVREGREEAGGTDSARRKPLQRLVEQSRDALEELQRVADSRMSGVVNVAIGQVHQLHNEVGRLQERIEELEARLVRMQNRRGRGESEPPAGHGSAHGGGQGGGEGGEPSDRD